MYGQVGVCTPFIHTSSSNSKLHTPSERLRVAEIFHEWLPSRSSYYFDFHTSPSSSRSQTPIISPLLPHMTEGLQ